MNSEFLGNRRRALEEEYFAKRNRALLERLRAAEAAGAKADDAKGDNANPGDADRPSEVDKNAAPGRLAE